MKTNGASCVRKGVSVELAKIEINDFGGAPMAEHNFEKEMLVRDIKRLAEMLRWTP